jgi:hypothetical protein
MPLSPLPSHRGARAYPSAVRFPKPFGKPLLEALFDGGGRQLIKFSLLRIRQSRQLGDTTAHNAQDDFLFVFQVLGVDAGRGEYLEDNIRPVVPTSTVGSLKNRRRHGLNFWCSRAMSDLRGLAVPREASVL